MTHDILVVDDTEDNLSVMRELLEFLGYGVRTATSVADATLVIGERSPSLALIDLWLGSDPHGGIEVLKTMRAQAPLAPSIMISAHVNVESAVRAMELGAFTFLEKPIQVPQIREVVQRGLEYHTQLCESIGAQDHEGTRHYLTGSSGAIHRLRRGIERTAPTNARVLFMGAPGSGRREAARYLHLRSRRASRPFFQITATPLGNRIGSRDGECWPPIEVLRCANGGTLLINDIQLLPQEFQAGLRQLVTSRLGPVDKRGESRIDVRITAMAEESLVEQVRKGEFVRDLYERLAVVEFRVPPLVERLADIPALVDRIARERASERGTTLPQFTSEATKVMQQHDWPGNVRQLQKIVQDAVDRLADASPAIVDVLDLPSRFRAEAGIGTHRSVSISAFADMPVKEARTLFERLYFMELIERTHSNMPQMAQLSGMDRSALYRKLHSIGIGPDTLASYRVETAEHGSRTAVGAEAVEAPQEKGGATP